MEQKVDNKQKCVIETLIYDTTHVRNNCLIGEITIQCHFLRLTRFPSLFSATKAVRGVVNGFGRLCRKKSLKIINAFKIYALLKNRVFLSTN